MSSKNNTSLYIFFSIHIICIKYKYNKLIKLKQKKIKKYFMWIHQNFNESLCINRCSNLFCFVWLLLLYLNIFIRVEPNYNIIHFFRCFTRFSCKSINLWRKIRKKELRLVLYIYVYILCTVRLFVIPEIFLVVKVKKPASFMQRASV